MKRFILIACLIAFLAAPAFSEWRLDAGFTAPRGTGLVLGGGSINDIDGFQIENWPFIPIPELGAYYFGELGPLRLAAGIRVFSAIVESVAWPNAVLEFQADHFVLEAQLGGGFFLPFGALGTQFTGGKVFIPDLSAWYCLGKKGNLRLGAGLIGIYVPELLGDGIPCLLYFGGKVTVPL